MSQQPKLINYVSDVDQFLQQFDRKHPSLSQSQQKEQLKYRRIYQLRDSADRDTETTTLWEGF